jgi:hypothetical protein
MVTALILRFDLAPLLLGTTRVAGHVTFRSAPGQPAETDADQNCRCAVGKASSIVQSAQCLHGEPLLLLLDNGLGQRRLRDI